MNPHPVPPTRPCNALLVGTDQVLLYTRKAILQKEGFVISTAPPADAIATLSRSDFDLVVGCHTLSPAEADSLVQAARANPVRPALIGFTKGPSPLPTQHPFDASVWSLATPENLVGTVRELLRSRSNHEHLQAV